MHRLLADKTQVDAMAEARQPTAGARQFLQPQWLRLLASIRLGEVLVLQGTPLMGAILALGNLAPWHGWTIVWQRPVAGDCKPLVCGACVCRQRLGRH